MYDDNQIVFVPNMGDEFSLKEKGQVVVASPIPGVLETWKHLGCLQFVHVGG